MANGDFLFLDVAGPPCFTLSQPNERWFSVRPDKDIENRIYDFFMNRLESDEDAFHDLAIVGQMELLAVVCASHNWEYREMDDDDWIPWMRYLNSCILQEPLEENGQFSGLLVSSLKLTPLISGKHSEIQQSSGRPNFLIAS